MAGAGLRVSRVRCCWQARHLVTPWVTPGVGGGESVLRPFRAGVGLFLAGAGIVARFRGRRCVAACANPAAEKRQNEKEKGQRKRKDKGTNAKERKRVGARRRAQVLRLSCSICYTETSATGLPGN